MVITMPTNKIEGKSAVVTGGTRGIGYAITDALSDLRSLSSRIEIRPSESKKQ